MGEDSSVTHRGKRKWTRAISKYIEKYSIGKGRDRAMMKASVMELSRSGTEQAASGIEHGASVYGALKINTEQQWPNTSIRNGDIIFSIEVLP